MSEGCKNIFVYGTLKRTFHHPMGALLRAHADFIGDGSISGLLYDFGQYPGVILAPDGNRRVYGELYQMREEERLLAALDDYEGCGKRDEKPYLFVREKLPVELSDETAILAWVYIFNRDPSDGLLIAAGNFGRS